MIIIVTGPLGAQEREIGKPRSSGDEPIHITADRLITDTKQNTAEFRGNVSAKQGNTTINADSLFVYYENSSVSAEGSNAGMDTITRIVAKGSVKIVANDQIAFTEHADYFADKGTIVLTGPNSRLVSGKNSVTGQKITLFRDDGRVFVEGTQDKPVEAFFYSQENKEAVIKEKK